MPGDNEIKSVKCREKNNCHPKILYAVKLFKSESKRGISGMEKFKNIYQ